MQPNNETIESLIQHPDQFNRRHIGPDATEAAAMLEALNEPDMATFIGKVVPAAIRIEPPLADLAGLSEYQALERLRSIAAKNQPYRSLIGQGYSSAILPPVVQRNILCNPGWYTAYTPYQAEISQGRLEMLLAFQTMVCELTGLDIANASLLDEATAAAEAMGMAYAARGKSAGRDTFWVEENCHPQTIAVVRTRAAALGIKVVVSGLNDFAANDNIFAALVQYPNTRGVISDFSSLASELRANGGLLVVAADILALTLLTPPAEFGADVVVGSSQRFGMPLCFGGPHAAFFATKDEFKRQMPGRLIGVSKDADGRKAMRLSLQTREQHIRRDKATSNICTAQVLPAVVATAYAIYHGPEQLKQIALRVHQFARILAQGLQKLGIQFEEGLFFDTLTVKSTQEQQAVILQRALESGINLRAYPTGEVGIALDELTNLEEVSQLLFVVSGNEDSSQDIELGASPLETLREKPFMQQEVFLRHHSETEMLRFLKRLENKDLSLTYSMISLGSCTMKLNATAEMFPVTWPLFANIHPLAPADQTEGYAEMISQLEGWLAALTGFAAVSLQPNSGANGEYAGLLTIRAYHESRGEGHRNICLIPNSAHGTNFASAAMAGFEVVVAACDANGEIDLNDLRDKAVANREKLACVMVTYPSTHGLFEEKIRELCGIIHENGGQVYMDGANMNAQVGLCSPGTIGADVCHLNLHKTFAIPHGGGGPGVGPICVAGHLREFLPGNPAAGGRQAVSAANFGSAGVLCIPWMYIAMMGGQGLMQASCHAILNANYIAKRLEGHYPILFRGEGYVAHECILDLRPLKAGSGVEVEDVAKRLIDYGFHAPTMSWPIPGTLMVEPTESESKEELDRFCDALIAIRQEIAEIEQGVLDKANNPLKNAPHPAESILADAWNRPYSRERAAYPLPYLRENKYWPPVSRVDNVYGDRNLFCSCG
jgi:glycine dehydrogenase